jgi:hypothetical protein
VRLEREVEHKHECYDAEIGARAGAGYVHNLICANERPRRRQLQQQQPARRGHSSQQPGVKPNLMPHSTAALKNPICLSDNEINLRLLTKLRMDDYTMRDRAIYAERRFKKVIV